MRRPSAAAPCGGIVICFAALLLTRESAEALKQCGLSNRGLIRASAVVGASFWKVIVTFLQMHGREEMKNFDDEASALDWLASA